MTKQPAPSGYVFYEGPSMLTGAPIVAIATMESTNGKTGNMIQTWILVQDRDPLAANRSGADIAICGKCPSMGKARPGADKGLAEGRACYVDLVHGPLGIYTAWKAGRYPRVTGHAAIAAIGHGRKVRLGAYGDPAAVPAYCNQSLVSECDGHTAYSHQSNWAGPTGFDASIMMVSADSRDAAEHAWERGARTFRVIADARELVRTREVLCPASEEAGKRTQCIRCLLCGGAAVKAKSVAIVVHGAGRKHHTAAAG